MSSLEEKFMARAYLTLTVSRDSAIECLGRDQVLATLDMIARYLKMKKGPT